MAGRGPAPKPADQRARRNKDPIAMRTIEVEPAPQPRLPRVITPPRTRDGEPEVFVWPKRTREWWRMWGESPLSADFTENDWSELLDTAIIHAKFWNGDTSLASELRQRAAKFGATPEDRARLRIQFAQADDADAKVARKKATEAPAGGYSGLRAVD